MATVMLYNINYPV